MPVLARLGHRIGKKAGYVGSVLLFAGGGLALLGASPDRPRFVYAVFLVMGTAYAGTQLFPLAMLPDTVAADTHRTGLRRAGAYTGVWTAGEKAGAALGPAVLAALLAVTGFVETEGGAIVDQPAAAITGVVLGVAVLPAALVLASLLLLLRYDLDELTVRSFTTDLQAAAAATADPAAVPPVAPADGDDALPR
jgi:glycoside/pentoside/hexuronide:cation symporter, GPH family